MNEWMNEEQIPWSPSSTEGLLKVFSHELIQSVSKIVHFAPLMYSQMDMGIS